MYLSDDALPRLNEWSGEELVDHFLALPLRSGLESVCDKSLKEPWDPEACKELWELDLILPAGADGTAKPLWSPRCDWSPTLKNNVNYEQVNYYVSYLVTLTSFSGAFHLLDGYSP